MIDYLESDLKVSITIGQYYGKKKLKAQGFSHGLRVFRNGQTFLKADLGFQA
jgi:hypothetical protein